MSLKHKNFIEYWADVAPRLDSYLEKECNIDVINVLNSSIAFFSFITEDLGTKINENKKLSPQLDLFLIYAHDQIRCSLPLYLNLNLAPTAIAARATFENYVNLKYILNSGFPFFFTDRYNRYKEIIRLKAHRNSTVLVKLSQKAEADILSKNCDWLDPQTGKLQKKTHWTAINGMNLETMTKKLDISDLYSIYRSTSQFIHASSITTNLYNQPKKGLGSIASENQSRRMALLIAFLAMDTLNEFCIFFGVSLDEPNFLGLMQEIKRLSS